MEEIMKYLFEIKEIQFGILNPIPMHKYKRTEIKKELKRYVKNAHVCSVCGLERSHLKKPDDSEVFTFWRSGILFHWEPQCIDEEIENQKTID